MIRFNGYEPIVLMSFVVVFLMVPVSYVKGDSYNVHLISVSFGLVSQGQVQVELPSGM